MNDAFRPCRKRKGERVRPARRGWRPAQHIFAPCPWRRTKLCAATGQIPGLEKRGAVRPATSAAAVAGPPKTAAKKTGRTVKAVKSVFPIFQLEPVAVQSVPTQIGGKDFTAFALILRMGMGGRGSGNPHLNPNPSPSRRVALPGMARRRQNSLVNQIVEIF